MCFHGLDVASWLGRTHRRLDSSRRTSNRTRCVCDVFDVDCDDVNVICDGLYIFVLFLILFVMILILFDVIYRGDDLESNAGPILA